MQRAIEPFLIKWKNQENRLPIILRGARQVGKSFLIESFGKTNFESTVTINLEFRPELAACFDDLDPAVICSRLEIASKTRIVPGKTLLFLDEIQNCPKAIAALRYFKEKLPTLHVVAAGSLLEFALREEDFSFPVGRIQFLYLKPLSFSEYLMNQGHEPLNNYLKTVSINKPVEQFVHNQVTTLLREYFLLGGMPAIVKCYLETRSWVECQILLTGLLETYRADFAKYASKAQHKYLQIFFEQAPRLVTKHFKYSHVSQDHRSADLKVALQQLGWAGLVHRILATSASGVPLSAHAKDNKFKLLFLDIGLLNSANNLDLQVAWTEQLMQINAGALAEQFVGQELLAYADPHAQPQLYYWERDKHGAMAEVDFVLQARSHIVPVEVKAGSTGTLRSIRQFLEEKRQPFGVRISHHPLSFHDNILSIPLYLIQEIPRLLDEITSHR